MSIRSIIGLVCVLGATALAIYKVRQMRSRWRRPRVWALWGAISSFGMAQLFSVPENEVWVDRVSGIPNLAFLFIFSFISTGAASFLTLALVWRYPARVAWPKVRWVLTVHGLVIVLLTVLFVLSSVPEERPTDFPVHYAKQPTVTALSTLVHVAAMISFTVLAYWCLTWARSRDFGELPWLRRGLILYGSVALTFTFWLVLAEVTTVSANWFDTSALGAVYEGASNILPLVAVVLLTSALVVPVWGPRWPAVRRWLRRWRAFLALRSLHRTLRPVAPASVVVAQGKRLDPHHRVRRMVIELNDWRTALSALFDPAVRQAAERRGQGLGLTGERLEALVEAAQLQAAARAWQAGTRAPTADASDDEGIRDGSGSIDTELAWWIRVARAYRTS